MDKGCNRRTDGQMMQSAVGSKMAQSADGWTNDAIGGGLVQWSVNAWVRWLGAWEREGTVDGWMGAWIDCWMGWSAGGASIATLSWSNPSDGPCQISVRLPGGGRLPRLSAIGDLVDYQRKSSSRNRVGQR